jgi:hypothetical protein
MLRLATAGLALFACILTLPAQSPDVIVGNLSDTSMWGQANGITAYSVGTVSCNIGNANLTWIATNNLHPVIAQNMYRLKDGRFEQLGQSWLKHGFYALSGTYCGGPCINGSPNGTWLGVGCSDPYGSDLNGTQFYLGPRNEVNSVTGNFPYPIGNYPAPHPIIGQRLQVQTTEVNPANNAGAFYFVEGHYVHPEDAAANNRNNNASWREVTVLGNYHLSWVGATNQQQPAIYAWQAKDPTVQIKVVDIPGDGRILVAFKGTPGVGSTYHYEFAVQNLNSDRAIGSFSVEMWPGANPTNIGFRDVAYHSGEPYVGTDWTPTHTPGQLFPGQLTWACTPYASNVNANALRWGTMYNFWFDCDQLPGNASFGLFKPPTALSPATSMAVPAFCAPRRPTPGPPAPYAINSTIAYDYVNISASGTLGPIGDDTGFAVPIPFAFPFYGQSFSSVGISTNGYLALPGTGDLTKHTNTTLPDPGLPQGMIAAYWDDLDCPNLGNIRYQTVGTAPNRRFVVYWNAVHLGSALPVQFEAILEEGGNIVTTIVQCPGSPFGGATATRGIESPSGADGLQLSFNSPNSVLSTTSARYEVQSAVPISSNLFYSGSLGGGFFRMVYTGATLSPAGTPVVSWASQALTPINLGTLGIVYIDPPTAIGILDYYGILTGFPNPAAVTDSACGALSLQFFISPGSVPSGFLVFLGGVDYPANPLFAMNGQFNIGPAIAVVAP